MLIINKKGKGMCFLSNVSVVVPIYNAEKKLDKCINSLLNQTLNDIEIILVNDGSIDKSLEICKKYQKKDKRVVVIDKKNEGSIATRRKGVEVSNSNYIMFVDADDWIEHNTIEILYKELTQNSVDIVVCNIYKVIGNGLLIKQKNNSKYFSEDRIYNSEEIKKELVVAYFYGHPFPANLVAKLYKKELLIHSGKYLKKIKFLGEDLYYNLEIFLKAGRVKIIDRSLYFYRAGGFTSKYMPYLFDDMIAGYEIQKEVIAEYYQETRENEFKGISIMLLNTFKTCLYNLFDSEFDERRIKEIIKSYLSNQNLLESINNSGAINYFEKEYLNAIKNRDIKFLYELGKKIYINKRPRKLLVNILGKIPII